MSLDQTPILNSRIRPSKSSHDPFVRSWLGCSAVWILWIGLLVLAGTAALETALVTLLIPVILTNERPVTYPFVKSWLGRRAVWILWIGLLVLAGPAAFETALVTCLIPVILTGGPVTKEEGNNRVFSLCLVYIGVYAGSILLLLLIRWWFTGSHQ